MKVADEIQRSSSVQCYLKREGEEISSFPRDAISFVELLKEPP
jgi:hypothetical protein